MRKGEGRFLLETTDKRQHQLIGNVIRHKGFVVILEGTVQEKWVIGRPA